MRFLLFIFSVLFLCPLAVEGQEGDNTMYFLSNLPQRIRLNPAFQPEYNAYVGLPGLSGVKVNYTNTSFSVGDLLKKKSFGRTDSIVMDLNSFHKALKKRNSVIVNNENSLLTVGFRVKSWYATVDITQKNDFVFSFNKDLITFIKEGNADYLGKTFDLGKFGTNVNSYVETAFGLSKKVNDRLTVGGRFKVLFGIANMDMTDSEMDITTVGQGETLRLHSLQKIRFSAPIKPLPVGEYVDWDNIEFDDDNLNAGMVTGNLGLGLDLGGEYKLLDRLTLHASLLDVGFIHWGENTHTFLQDKTFDWQGADVSGSINKDNPEYISMDDAFQNMLDSLKDGFRFMDNTGGYTTALNAKLYLGATYDVCPLLNVGALFKASLINNRFYPGISFSANARLIRNIGASVSYSVMAGNYTNIGAGLTAKLGPVQLYVVTDNTLAGNWTATRQVNARVGINLLFGHREKVELRRESRAGKNSARQEVTTEQVSPVEE